MRLVIQPRARADILEQVDYLLEVFAYDAAARFPEAVQEACTLLLEHPTLGSPREFAVERLAGVRAWPVPGFEDVRVYYLAERDLVRVVRVLHRRRDVVGIFREEE
jgi:plasmid stabilization system protein ParE